ncbi:formyltetrahydrofolate deformylase [Wohlfahrtiimonas sp. G9077]|uniref:formyltetrahydrofolate deformylase n=1 Tax=Wohlfahrtiimonas sp. G9077 TaxID=1980118 RepID=UPI000B98BF2E|nr:formyltetrahydrofolate deformylase [Wohlfahrtiimonas sp. G9077]OYQ75438.1 formyltetrahydrofolate deformylase [Wohlfahrtiimonas sp. G9077]
MNAYRLTMSCPDGVGIVAGISGFIAEHGGWIAEANHHSDFGSGYFFMRHVIQADSLSCSLDEFKERFAPMAEKFSMKWKISETAVKKRVVLMASKDSHCLVDLLSRWQTGELDCDIVAVISNHDDLRSLVEWYNVPYHHVPVNPLNKSESFTKVENLMDELRADTIVLARYMQIIPPDLCERYQHKIINIHHSFLPSFVGARPYHQAAQRGVKLIGATCHYVTQDLDAGPIIDQDVTRITHADNVQDMIRLGRDIEKIVLARGLRYHIEDRVLVHGNHTVVF